MEKNIVLITNQYVRKSHLISFEMISPLLSSHYHVYERMNTNAFFILFPILSVILFALLAEFQSGESK